MPRMSPLSTWIRDYTQDPRHLSRLLADQFVWKIREGRTFRGAVQIEARKCLPKRCGTALTN
jgi:hypothetical protein